MASADVTLSDSGAEVEVDTTQRTATLRVPGGRVRNDRSTTIYINVDAGTVSITDPQGVSGRKLEAKDEALLSPTCRAFTFKTAAGSGSLVYYRP